MQRLTEKADEYFHKGGIIYYPKDRGLNKAICNKLGEYEDLEEQGLLVREKGKWELLDDCANAGVYCSNCSKKVYRVDYANQKVKSKYCPNCGAKMEE